MDLSVTPATLNPDDWIDRCTRRIVECDPAIPEAEARVLAAELHAFERTRCLDPVDAVDFVASELGQPSPRFERRAVVRSAPESGGGDAALSDTS